MVNTVWGDNGCGGYDGTDWDWRCDEKCDDTEEPGWGGTAPTLTTTVVCRDVGAVVDGGGERCGLDATGEIGELCGLPNIWPRNDNPVGFERS